MSSLQAAPHPLGVLPWGQMLLEADPSAPLRDKRGSLGALAALEDHHLLAVFHGLDAVDLVACTLVSHWCRAWAELRDNWRRLALHKASTVGELPHPEHEDLARWQAWSGWKGCLQRLQASPRPRPPAAAPVRCQGVYSDLLFHSHVCAAAQFPTRWVARDNVPRRGSDLKAAEFRAAFELPNRPVVLTQPCTEPLTVDMLNAEFSGSAVHVAGYNMSFGQFVAYMRSTAQFDDLPLYLFDKKFDQTMPALVPRLQVPSVFTEDLFDTLGADRPDWRWLIVGSRRSGSNFHVDPNCTSAWNLCLSGAKKWVLFPPDVVPPGVYPSRDGGSVATPLTIVEWFSQFYTEACEAPPARRPLECVVRTGEAIFVPRGWWHMAVNLEETVALTQNYVSRANLGHVLRFLRQQPHNVSGCPLHARHDLHARFEAALERDHPALLAEVRQADRAASERPAAAETPSVLATAFTLSKAQDEGHMRSDKRRRCGDHAVVAEPPAFSFGFTF